MVSWEELMASLGGACGLARGSQLSCTGSPLVGGVSGNAGRNQWHHCEESMILWEGTVLLLGGANGIAWWSGLSVP